MADSAVTWDILIPSVPHRHEKLLKLLASLDGQMRPGVGCWVYRDNRGLQIGPKDLAMAQHSQADYLTFVDDDDRVARDYIPRILTALGEWPDYVGFVVRYSVDGLVQQDIPHSLRYGEWGQKPSGQLVRDISRLNPIRREMVLSGHFTGSRPGEPPGGHGSDRYFADSLRGKLQTEVWIPDPMYFYDYSTADNYGNLPPPKREWHGDMPELPSYPWLTVLG